MRCAHCAAEIPESSHYCGICGHSAEAVSGRPERVAANRESFAGTSLFSGDGAGWNARVVLVLLLDAILISAGAFMIMSYASAPSAEEEEGEAFRLEETSPSPLGGGTTDADVVRWVEEQVEKEKVGLAECYARAAQLASPESPLAGRMDVRFTVTPMGTTDEVHAVRNTTGSKELERCVTGIVRAFQLPSGPLRPVEFAWPFLFRVPL